MLAVWSSFVNYWSSLFACFYASMINYCACVRNLCCITACGIQFSFILSHAQSWHHSNACISFMHYSDRAIGERTHRAGRSCWTQAQCGVCCWPRGKPRQAASMIPCIHLILCNLVISFGYYWVMYIVCYVLYFCIYFYAFTFLALLYPCPCHL